jgi:type IV secretion system protein VirB10
MRRLFVLWSEARTPNGVVIPLASPATDDLGRGGVDGVIDRHFASRFGAAILISVIDGAIQAASRNTARDGGIVITPSGSRDVLTEVLRNTVRVPPTLRKNQGERIQALTARDVDFRAVYKLSLDHETPLNETRGVRVHE